MSSIQSILEEFFEIYLVVSLRLDYMASYLKSLVLVLADRSNVCIKEVLATTSKCDSKCSFLASLLSFCCDFHLAKKKKKSIDWLVIIIYYNVRNNELVIFNGYLIFHQSKLHDIITFLFFKPMENLTLKKIK